MIFWRAFPLQAFVVLIITMFCLCFPFSEALSSELSGSHESTKWEQSPGGDLSQNPINLEDWGIYDGCISSNRIQKIKVLDAHSAMLSLVDGKRVKIRFMGRCQGIKQHGFVYTARNNMFCTHNYSVRVLNTGAHCQVESLEPYFGSEVP